MIKIGNTYYRNKTLLNEEIITISSPEYTEYVESSEEKKSELKILEKCEKAQKKNPQYVVEYSYDIFEYLFKHEKINCAEIGYFNNGFQKEINEKMRAILVDWVIEVHNKFKLVPETLYLSINLIDRYLSVTKIQKSKFQLLGISAMLIASKYEEIYAPEVRDFIYITDKIFTKEEIIEMESEILAKLNFDILSTSPYRFLERFHFISNDGDKRTFFIAQYLIELSLLEYKMLIYPPSMKASAALFLSRKILKIDAPNCWNNTLQFHTNYKEKELVNCAKDYCSILELVPRISLKSCYKKFAADNYEEASVLINQKLSSQKEEVKK
jgi:hypothetical protein